jgi:predicted dehydrogenase
VDYPAGYVRWTEGRNLEAVLDLLASGRLAVADLVTHRFPIEQATTAYELIERRSEPYLGVQLEYPRPSEPNAPVFLGRPRRRVDTDANVTGIGLVGAGAFASTVLVPALRDAGFERLVAVASASGLSARGLAERAGFEKAVAGASAVIHDPDVRAVVIATTHDTHSSLVIEALQAGKHVYCEKPLAITADELDAVEAAWRESGAVLFVGFNRRWSKPVSLVRQQLEQVTGPIVVAYRVNAGHLPEGHWYNDRRQGGRLLGEVCHFVDTCAALVGADANGVTAVAASSPATERAIVDDVVVSLVYPSGSLASIVYATGGPTAMGKERIEVLGGGISAVIDDFRRIAVNGKAHALRSQDKGHRAEAVAFRDAIDAAQRDDPSIETLAPGSPFATMRTTFAAAAAITSSA